MANPDIKHDGGLPVAYRQATLQMIVSTARKELRKELGFTAADEPKLRAYTKMVADSLVYELSTWVLGQKIVDDKYHFFYEMSFPKSVWQMFKDRHMPQWFKRKWPVLKESYQGQEDVIFERWATYPKSNINIPKDGPLYTFTLGGLEVIKDSVYKDERNT